MTLFDRTMQFLKNKLYCATLILAVIAGYGYELTHASYGVDDVEMERYLVEGLNVAIGRWPLFIINKICGISDFAPFIVDFFQILFLMLSATLLCVLIESVVGEKEVPMIAYSIVACMFIDYPLISDVFVYYLSNGVGIAYALTIIAVYLLFHGECDILSKIVKKNLEIIICMSIAISFYESFAGVYVFLVVLMIFLECLLNNTRKKGKLLINACICLIIAVGVRSITTHVLLGIIGIEGDMRSVTSAFWIFRSDAVYVFKHLLKHTVYDYVIVGVAYWPITIFAFFSVGYYIFCIAYSFIKKKLGIIMWGTIVWVSIFFMSFITGEVIPYRANQILNIFIAIILFGGIYYSKKYKKIQILIEVGSFILVYNAAHELTLNFYDEYRITQRDYEIVNKIGNDLCQFELEDKKIVFIGGVELGEGFVDRLYIGENEVGYSIVALYDKYARNDRIRLLPYGYPIYSEGSHSVLNWSVTAFNEPNTVLQHMFASSGYDFAICEDMDEYRSICEEVNEFLQGASHYPQEGYLYEYMDYIIVNL